MTAKTQTSPASTSLKSATITIAGQEYELVADYREAIAQALQRGTRRAIMTETPDPKGQTKKKDT